MVMGLGDEVKQPKGRNNFKEGRMPPIRCHTQQALVVKTA